MNFPDARTCIKKEFFILIFNNIELLGNCKATACDVFVARVYSLNMRRVYCFPGAASFSIAGTIYRVDGPVVGKVKAVVADRPAGALRPGRRGTQLLSEPVVNPGWSPLDMCDPKRGPG
ncbi:hypothetical protein [Burkholderia ubonensis]|uniref:hypothetical protein n=1 Tax=Burkholderia ubonensis TaxID=101571 RepID=UPI0012F74873|nr:hypothetical protein [Burkholderia ubonensis]